MKKILLLALLIRLVSIYLFRNITNYDLESYFEVGGLTLRRVNIYPQIANLHHPYFPFFLYLEAISLYLGKSKLIMIMIIKIINVFFDLGILFLVYKISKNNLNKAFLYAVNPVTILITTLHGQFDVIPVFFILVSIYFLGKKRQIFAILAFSFAILTKTWPLLFFIPISRKFKNKKFLIIIFVFPLLFSAYYAFRFRVSIIKILLTVISYQGLWGIWGIGKLFVFPLRIVVQKFITVLFLVILAFYSLRNKRKLIVSDFLNILFFFFIFTTSFSIQYFVWITPFLIIKKTKNYLSLIILISFYLSSFYYFWFFCLNCKETPNWLIILQNIIGLVLWLSFIKVRYFSQNKC